jgi:diguanylate cyclase (GGDEF)-like protein/PAS domain S-box-containing protein
MRNQIETSRHKKDQNQTKVKFWSWRNLTQILILALLYFVFGKASFSVSVAHNIVTLVVFAAEGFALAAVILCGRRVIPGVFLGQLLLALDYGLGWMLALGIAVVNSLEALIGLKLFQRFRLCPGLDTLRDISGLQLLVFLILQPFSATFGILILRLGGILQTSEYTYAWLSWWFGNSLGQILVAPVLLSMFSQFQVQRNQFLKGLLPLLPLFSIAWLVFFVPLVRNVSTIFAIFMPWLTLLAVWQGMAIVTLATITIAATALYATSCGMGPFVINGQAQLLDLNIFLLGATLAAQFIATLFAERKQTEQQLRLSASLFDRAQEGIVIFNPDRQIIELNYAFTQITGYAREEIMGCSARMILENQLNPEAYDNMWHIVQTKGYWHGKIFSQRKSGELYPEWLTLSSVPNRKQKVTHYIAFFVDTAELKNSHRELLQLALFDPLTGLPNRRLLFDRLEQEMQKAARSNDLIAICYLDLDGFKLVNDTFGHEAGDKLLIEIANRIRGCIRSGDTMARIGGDEFVIILSSLHSVTQYQPVVQRILDAVSEPALINTQLVSVSVSIGITIYPHDRSDVKELLRHADAAMYSAKKSGKGQYLLFNPQQDIA